MKTMLAVILMLVGGLPAVSLGATRTVTLAVPGMTCPICPITIKESLEKVAGVTAVASDVEKKTATVTYDDAKAQPAALTRATADAGYPSTIRH